MSRTHRHRWFTTLAVLGACADPRDDAHPDTGIAAGADTADGQDTGADTGAALDLGVGDSSGGPAGGCHVVDELDAPPPCQDRAPPDSFEPEVQWSWSGESGEIHALVIPLVANLTDDNGDGSVDLCDVPDIVVVANAGGVSFPPGYIYVVSGDDGHTHVRFPTAVDSWVTPALGDIDGDGDIEIVSATLAGEFIAFAADGTVEWTSAPLWAQSWGGAIALADIDGDGAVEIIADNMVVSNTGTLRWSAPGREAQVSVTTVANIDGIPGMEIITGGGVYRTDGSVVFEFPLPYNWYAQVANLDDDPEPELLYTGQGISVFDADGTPLFENLRPSGTSMVAAEYQRPAAIHDFDGDGSPDFASSTAYTFAVHHRDGALSWLAMVEDVSGRAAGTGFDFLGDGTAEAMYGDESNNYVFGADGALLFSVPRHSGTLIEYPVVADVDNDGSAEIVVVNGVSVSPPNPRPTLEVIRDVADRWVGARRIWNQHTYHVTNVREDGSIPTVEVPSWEYLNTFRTNAQVQGTGVCLPVPEG